MKNIYLCIAFPDLFQLAIRIEIFKTTSLMFSLNPPGMQADSHPALLYEALLPFLSKEDAVVFS